MKYFDSENQHLVFYGKEPTANYWDEHWDCADITREIENDENFNLIAGNTKRFLLPDVSTKILEGGCGRGGNVSVLKKIGYDSYGVDYAENTVKKVSAARPDLKISLGNVERLDFSDGFFDGYWSIGVIEHFYHGYGKVANEMRRVLKPGGFLFITFPYMSPLRKMKAKFGTYIDIKNTKIESEYFYQYALNHKEVTEYFEDHGFAMVYDKPYDAIKGIKDEINVCKTPLQYLYDNNNILCNLVSLAISKLFSWFGCHSILLVFKKK